VYVINEIVYSEKVFYDIWFFNNNHLRKYLILQLYYILDLLHNDIVC